MILDRFSKRVVFLVAFSFIFFVSTVVIILGQFGGSSHGLLPYAVTQEWVIQDMRLLLTLNESNFEENSAKLRFTEDLRRDLVGESFDKRRLPSADEVRFIEVRYTLGDSNNLVLYISAELVVGDSIRVSKFLVFVSGNKVYKILSI